MQVISPSLPADASGAELFAPCSKNQFQTSMVVPDAKASMEEPDVEFQIVDA